MNIALMYAMRSEIASLLRGDETPLLQTVAGVEFYRIRPNVIACCGGVGKVNAAMSTQLLISLYRPDLIINVGVAGCFENVPIGTLVLADGFCQHDFDTSAIDGPEYEGVVFINGTGYKVFPTSDPEKARTAMEAAGYSCRTGLVATGDWFATDTPRARHIAEKFHPLLCEMEGGAVAHVCLRNGVPFMAVKSVSDCLFSDNDYYFNFPAAMERLGAVVLDFIGHLED
ncbi:MAG: 5'-methylthioadenosine/S-adenosylhomocysteine nucleosidase [Oscillospiraceae bacterium]|nr:5'-methylthioadenosine/S-adenosylhomocysteine nucleosidase [Oscillospiraceae bacterium]